MLSHKLQRRSIGQKEAAMYELFGALAFATLVAGYILAVVFIRHDRGNPFGGRQSIRHEE
jgi:hypothetical protein